MKKYATQFFVGLVIFAGIVGIAILCHQDFMRLKQIEADEQARAEQFEKLKKKMAAFETLQIMRIREYCRSIGGEAIKTASQNKFDYACVKKEAVLF